MKDILDKCVEIFDLNDPDFAEQFRQAIGAKPGEAVEIVAPQFERTDGLVPPIPQIDFSKLAGMPKATLREIGCQPWDEPNERGEALWLYPAEWYNFIPDGTLIVTINGSKEIFKRGETDDDMRFGALAYGFIKADER